MALRVNFRNLFKWLVPSWLSTGDGEKVLHTLAMIKDAHTERLLQGLEARFPSRAHASALALIGADRGIIRGRVESDATYAARLIGWRWPRGHRVRGNAFALLEQVWAYFSGVRAWTIDRGGNRYERTFAGVETYSAGNAWNWDGAALSPNWARFWMVLDPNANPDLNVSKHLTIDDPNLWGGLSFDDAAAAGYILDCDGLTLGDAESIRRLLLGKRIWKPAGTRAEFAIITFDGAAPVPDGTWGKWTGRDDAFGYWFLR